MFDRKSADDSSALDWINKLKMKVALNENVFSGGRGTLYMADDHGHTIESPLGSKSLEFAINGKDLEHINNTWPYKPEVGIRFEQGTTVQILRGLGAVRIDFDAEISYRYKFEKSAGSERAE